MDILLVREAIADRGLDAELNILEDGEAAIEFIQDIDKRDDGICGPTVVLLDLNLPRATGFEVLSHLRKSQKCARVPVIVMTSSPARADRERTAALGANAYFLKPSGIRTS